MSRNSCFKVVSIAALTLWATNARAAAGSIVQVTSFGSNPGGLRMWKYVPPGMPAHAPLVLALHACSQQAADYVKAGWNELADQYQFYVVYPEQTTVNNGLTCFNWAGSNSNRSSRVSAHSDARRAAAPGHTPAQT